MKDQQHLRNFIESLPVNINAMRNQNGHVNAPSGTESRIIANEIYVTYHEGSRGGGIQVTMPAGEWDIEFFKPSTGQRSHQQRFTSTGARVSLNGPSWNEDMAWVITKVGAIEPNQPPAIVTPASIDVNPVSGTAAQLSVSAADADGDNLTYNWAATTKPAGANPSFTGGAQSMVTFDMAGEYVLTVTVSDGRDEITSTLSVTVEQTASELLIIP